MSKVELYELLNNIIPNSEDLKYLLKYLSLNYFDTTTIKRKSLFLIGNGLNGKSVLKMLIKKTFDKLCYELKETTFTKDTKHIFTKEDSIKLEQCKQIICEMYEEILIDTNMLKMFNMSKPIIIQQNYGAQFELQQNLSVIFIANNMPNFTYKYDNIVCVKCPTQFVDNPTNEGEIKRIEKIDVNNYINSFTEILKEHHDLYLTEGLEIPKEIKDFTEICLKK